MKHFIFSLVFLFSTVGLAESPEHQNLTFNTALDFYQKKDQEKARQIFLEKLKEDRQHIPSLFNLSVIAAGQNKKGEAAAYLRHLKTLNANISGIDQLQTYVTDKLNVVIFPAHPGYLGIIESTLIRGQSLHLWLAVTWFSFLIFAWILLAYLKTRRRLLEEEAPLRTPSIGFFASLLFLGVCLILSTWKAFDETTVRGTVLAAQQDVKAGPAENEVQIFQLTEAEEVIYQQSLNGWHQVMTRDGKSGWIPPRSPLHFY